MNLFLPAGFDVSNISNVIVDQGIPGFSSPFASRPQPLRGYTEPVRSSLPDGSNTPTASTGQIALFSKIVNPPLEIRRTSLLTLKVFFGFTSYDLQPFNRFRTGFQTFDAFNTFGRILEPETSISRPRIAAADGSLAITFTLGDEIIGFAETTFLKNEAFVILRFEGLGLNLSDDSLSGGGFQATFSSSSRLPFGPVQVPTPFVRGDVNFLLPNVRLISRTSTRATGKTTSFLGIRTPSDMVVVALQKVTSFADLVKAPETPVTDIGLRSSISGSAATNSNIRGPVQLIAAASALASAQAAQTFIVRLVADAPAQALSVAIVNVGTTKFLSAAPVAITLTQTNLILSSRVSGMTLFVNLETRQFVVSPVLLSPVASIALTRRDLSAIDVQFVRGGRVVDLSFGSLGQIAVKDTFSEVPLAFNGAWQERGTGANTRYQFALNLNTDGINDLFSDDDGTASVTAKFELEWTEAGTLNTSLPTTAIIHNDLIRGGEGVPTVTAAASFALLAPDGSLFTISIDDDGILTATKS